MDIPLNAPLRKAMPTDTKCRDCKNILNDCSGFEREIRGGYWVVLSCREYEKQNDG